MSLEPHLRRDFRDDVVTVNLSSTRIRDEHIPEIIALLKQYPNIVSLDLSRNNLFFKNKSVLRELTSLEQIQELNLGDTDFIHNGEKEAIDCLLAMPNLKSLDVRETYISEESAKRLADKEGLLRLVLGLRQVENSRVPHKTFNEIQERFRGRMGKWTKILNEHRAALKAKKQSQQQSSADLKSDCAAASSDVPPRISSPSHTYTAQDFFNRQVPPERWKKLQAEAEEYDRRELEHAHALDMPLTGELLLAIVDADKKAKLSQQFEKLRRIVDEISQEIKPSASSRANQMRLELKEALLEVENGIVVKKEPPSSPSIIPKLS